MPAKKHIPSGQHWYTEKLISAGFEGKNGGMCFGMAHAAGEFMLLSAVDNFNKVLHKISTIDHIDHLKKRYRKKSYQLFNTIAAIQNPEKNPHAFDGRVITSQRAFRLNPYTFSKKLRLEGGKQLIGWQIVMTNKFFLNQFLMQLKSKIIETKTIKPILLQISNHKTKTGHALSLSYHLQKGMWYYLNPNHCPVKKIKSPDTASIVDKIFSGFSRSEVSGIKLYLYSSALPKNATRVFTKLMSKPIQSQLTFYQIIRVLQDFKENDKKSALSFISVDNLCAELKSIERYALLLRDLNNDEQKWLFKKLEFFHVRDMMANFSDFFSIYSVLSETQKIRLLARLKNKFFERLKLSPIEPNQYESVAQFIIHHPCHFINDHIAKLFPRLDLLVKLLTCLSDHEGVKLLAITGKENLDNIISASSLEENIEFVKTLPYTKVRNQLVIMLLDKYRATLSSERKQHWLKNFSLFSDNHKKECAATALQWYLAGSDTNLAEYADQLKSGRLSRFY